MDSSIIWEYGASWEHWPMANGHLCWHLLWKCCPSTTQRRRCFNHPRSVLHQSHPFQFWAQFEVAERTWGPSDYLATATQGCVVYGSVELRTNNRREGGSMRVRPGRTRGCVGLSSPQWWCWSKAHRINRTSLLSADRGIYQVFTKLTSSMARVTSYVSKSIAISRFENIPGYCICPRWWWWWHQPHLSIVRGQRQRQRQAYNKARGHKKGKGLRTFTHFVDGWPHWDVLATLISVHIVFKRSLKI